MPRGGEDGRKPQQQQHAGAAGDADDKLPPRRNNQYGSRNRGRFYGKNRYNGPTGGGDRRHYKRARFDVGERLKEVDLGITEYVGDTEGFVGTIKEKFADFVVHEISIDGEIAKMTNQDIPPEPDASINVEELKSKIPEDVWEQVQKITENPDVEIDVTNMDRNQRKYIHQIVKKLTEVYSETKEVGDKKLIVFSKYGNSFGSKRDGRTDWSSRGGDYCYFILHKFNLDTMDALNQIAKVLRLKASIFSYAGTKDRRAKTTQWISVKKINPKNIWNAARTIKGAFVGNFKFEKEPLKLGKLYGNRFTIALRNVSAPDDLIAKAMTSLCEKGFINYYGLQRFGTIAAIPTHEIGKALLRGNWEEAVDLILKPREGEQDKDLAEAREIFKNTSSAREAYQKIGRNDKIEAKLLWGINICGMNNLQGALDMIPRNTMLMYVHAYQSMVWNEFVSRRIKEFGLKPIAGDLVYENPNAKDEFISDDAQHMADEVKKITESVEKAAAAEVHDEKTDNPTDGEDSVKVDEPNSNDVKSTEDKTEDSNNRKEDDKSSEKDESDRLPKVKILTEEDLSNYTIEDVVMPQPGWKVVYPPYAKAWFEERLEKDGLTPDLKQKNKKYTLSGSYRKIIQIPQNCSWKIIRYNNTNQNLILSDIDEMRNVEPPTDNPDGKFKAIILQMSLNSASYATMALREALKCDTSSQTHAAQSAAFHEAREKQDMETAEQKQEAKLSTKVSDVEENIPHVENLKLKDRSSDENGHSTEDEACDKKTDILIANSVLDDSITESELGNALKSNDKITSSPLIDSSVEDKDSSDGNKSLVNEPLKLEIDQTNDSGIEPGHLVNA